MLKALGSVFGGWKPDGWTDRDPVRAVSGAWEEIVGADVAAHAWPVAIEGACLVVGTPSSAWSQQLQFLSDRILEGVRALPEGAGVARLVFRNGRARSSRGAPTRPAPRPRRVAGAAPSPPAADATEALQRLRARLRALRREAAGTCANCAAPVDAADVCAPCAAAADQARALAAQRLMYAAPWLAYAEVRAAVRGLTTPEYERARRQLLQRWWQILERARRKGALSRSRMERPIASSYILLHSGIAPERVTPAVVKNVLGEELAALVWGSEAVRANTGLR
jgi:predicted nucleic acid-binding Zn ribbon protein